MKINGQAVGGELGAVSNDYWIWERVGAVELTAGPATLALHDLTGYYGRCDAVLLTTDEAYRPPVEGWDHLPKAATRGRLHPIQKERGRLTGQSLDPRLGGVILT